MRNAVVYARYSSDNQREESITAQVRAIKEYAAKEGYYILKIYKDEAKTATTDDRKDFLQMIKDSKKGSFDSIIVHKLDRFARNRYDSAIYKRELKLNGVNVVSVTENLDGSPESVILESVLEGMAEYYSKNLSREVKKGSKETAFQCKHVGGIAPLGFDVGEDKKLIINEFEAEAVRLIYKMYIQGSSYGEIIDLLNEKGFKTKANKPFGKNSLYEILRQEKYIGNFVYNRRSKDLNGKYNNHKESKDIIRVEGGCPQIIDDITWLKVRKRMYKNKRIGGRNSAKVDYLLSGKIYCGKCGAAMVGHSTSDGKTKKKYYYYSCNNKKRTKQCDLKLVRKEFIEDLVQDHLYSSVFSNSVIEKSIDHILNYANSKYNKIPTLLIEYRSQLEKIETELNKTIDILMSGYRHDSIKNKMDLLEEEKKKLEEIILKYESDLSAVSFTREEVSNFMYAFKNFRTMDFKGRKKVIDMFVYKIVIYDDIYDMKIFSNPLSIENPNPKSLTARGIGSPRP